MQESGKAGLGPPGGGNSWVEVDRCLWQEVHDGLVWQVIAWADRDTSLSAIENGSVDGVTIILGFDAFHRQHLIRWPNPKPLKKLSNEDFQKLLDQAKKDALH